MNKFHIERSKCGKFIRITLGDKVEVITIEAWSKALGKFTEFTYEYKVPDFLRPVTPPESA